jgi:DNA-binding MarR family transcriptional regulator
MATMNDVRWLDESQQRVWRAYVVMQGRLNARLGQQLQNDSELSLSDFGVLVQLTDSPDARVRVLELARSLQWEKSRLSHHLGRMQKRGLVRREECPSDARGAFVAITDEGRRAIEQAAPQHVETVRRLFFADLTDAEVATLGAAFTKILARLDPADPPPTP